MEVAEENTDVEASAAPLPKKCPGIYNRKKSNRLLKLMTMYGESTDAVRIACIGEKFIAEVASCQNESKQLQQLL